MNHLRATVRKSDKAGVVRKSDDRLEPNVRESYAAEVNRTIARKVREARGKFAPRDGNGYPIRRTQEDVAQVLGVHRVAVTEIEAGRRKLSAVELVLLAEWLGCPVTELLP